MDGLTFIDSVKEKKFRYVKINVNKDSKNHETFMCIKYVSDRRIKYFFILGAYWYSES